jgi:hypothetical protein
MNAGGLMDSHSHGRGRWFDPSIAHSKSLLFQIERQQARNGEDLLLFRRKLALLDDILADLILAQ